MLDYYSNAIYHNLQYDLVIIIFIFKNKFCLDKNVGNKIGTAPTKYELFPTKYY